MYKTIQNPTEGVYKEKGSKFLAFAFHISDQEVAYGELESIFNDFSLEFDSKEFTDSCLFFGKVKNEETEKFRKRLELLYGIQFEIG